MMKILMPIDFSDATEPTVQFASRLCPKLDAEFCLLHVSGAELDDPNQGRAVLEPKLSEIVGRLQSAGCKARSVLFFGPAIETVLEQIESEKPAMVFVGAHGHGSLYDLIIGSVTRSVLKSGACPVLVVPAPVPPTEEQDMDMQPIIGWDDLGYPIF